LWRGIPHTNHGVLASGGASFPWGRGHVESVGVRQASVRAHPIQVVEKPLCSLLHTGQAPRAIPWNTAVDVGAILGTPPSDTWRRRDGILEGPRGLGLAPIVTARVAAASMLLLL
jgi:hypothetical protein